AFRALRDFELDFLTFFKRLEAVHLDCGEVRKQIFTAVIRGDKAEAFRVVEPLDGTCCHKKRLSILTNHTSRKSKKPRVTLPPLKTCPFILIKCVRATLVNSCHCSFKNFKSQGDLSGPYLLFGCV